MSTIRFAVAFLLSILIVHCSRAREWTDSSGVFTVEAEFLEASQTTVWLRKPNGVVIQVPLERFSEADQRYLRLLPGVDISPANPAISRIEQALAAKPAFEFVNTQLHRVTDFLAERGGIDIDFDTKALDEIGVGTDSPVTMQNKDGTLAEVLDRLLNPLRLTWLVRHDVLLITTPQEADASPETRVYVSRGNHDLAALIKDIRATTAPGSWGPGSCAVRQVTPGVLLICQTQPTHRLIENRYADKLRMIHPTDTAVVPHAVCKNLTLALNDCTPVAFMETPLDNVAVVLGVSRGVRIAFDRQALSENGISLDSPMTRLLKHARFRCVLDLVLADLGLTWFPTESGILITTRRRATEIVEVEYDARRLTLDPSLVDLTDALKNTVAPQMWHDPKASIAKHPEKEFALAVKNSWEVHWQLAQVLQDLRQAVR